MSALANTNAKRFSSQALVSSVLTDRSFTVQKFFHVGYMFNFLKVSMKTTLEKCRFSQELETASN